MKRKILLVDGYNMTAFWRETRPYFNRGELDAARTILLQKLSNYASFEGLEIIFSSLSISASILVKIDCLVSFSFCFSKN